MSKKLLLILAVIMIFSLSAAPTFADGPACSDDYTVQANDWLSKLADRYFGDIFAYPVIVDATNAAYENDNTYAKIVNADVIEVGQKLCVPSADDAAAYLAADEAAKSAFAGQTLVFSSRLWSPPNEQEFIRNEIIAPFEEEYGVTVDFHILDDNDILDQVTVQKEAGTITTDVIIAHNGNMANWLDAGYVTDLTPFVTNWTDRTFMETFSANTNRDGKQYFLPIAADVYLTLANKKALPYLPAGASTDNLTWEQYAAWANAIKDGEGEGKVCVTGIPMKSLVYMFGGVGLSYGAGFPDINSPEAVKAWEVYASMHDAFSPGIFNVDNCTDPMQREESWLTVFHNARAGAAYASNETAFILGPAPSGPAGIGTIAGASGYAIIEGAPHYDLAVEFVKYMTSAEVQVKSSKGTGGFIPTAEESLAFLSDEALDEVINKALLVLNNGVASGVPGSDYQDWGAVKQVYDDVFKDMIVGGDGTVDQAVLDAAQAKLEALKK